MSKSKTSQASPSPLTPQSRLFPVPALSPMVLCKPSLKLYPSQPASQPRPVPFFSLLVLGVNVSNHRLRKGESASVLATQLGYDELGGGSVA